MLYIILLAGLLFLFWSQCFSVISFSFAAYFYRRPRSSGQDNPFIFHHLKEKDGLSNNVINCFLKDSRGIFMGRNIRWIKPI